MGENLVIVESPAKAKTIEKFLGKDFVVKSSFGHIRDLAKKNLGIDVEHGFEPDYIIPEDKGKVVSELKSAAKKAKTVWLASDEDREGEAIAWHLKEALGLQDKDTKRIVFHEITKDAILNAIENPRSVNMDLVMAQQARRVLDRLVGFELSPVLWKKVKPQLSAGRVQSVALRLIVDREREIIAFNPTKYFKVEGVFHPEGTAGSVKVKAVLNKRYNTEQEAADFLERCIDERFSIESIVKKEAKRTPAPPFTTSGLQQEASRKFGFSVSQTMSIAQKLYESGYITYMRTDSTNLSGLAIGTAQKYITNNFGEEYSKVRQYKTKAKGAQEAHEAIRPTFIENTSIEGNANEKKLYELIWKRTIASQMADAVLEKTDITIGGEKISEKFEAKAEQILFDGFLKVYIESHDDEPEDESENMLLPKLSENQGMDRVEIVATEKVTHKPARYNEASLVKKLEELGIGRPSTYAPTITTLVNRGYIIKEDRPGVKRDYRELRLKAKKIEAIDKSEVWGKEKSKLFPENIGIVVTDFLSANFPDILDYGFTASVEESFDKVASGEMKWNRVIEDFYAPFHKRVEETTSADNKTTNTKAERLLGKDPVSGKSLYARMGKFGPLVQKGESDDPEKQFAGLKRGQLIENITVEEALKLFELPREVGLYNDKPVVAAVGRFGPYLKYNSTFTSITKGYDPMTITLEEAIELIEAKAKRDAEKFIKEFPEHEIQILNGRFGPYIKRGRENFKIPKDTNASDLTITEALEIIDNSQKRVKKSKKK